MNKSESIAALASALNKAQGEIKAAEMNAVNPFLKNKYADLGAIIEASRPALVKNGLSFSQLVGGDSNTISLESVLMHESGEWISQTVALPIGDEKGRSLAQNAGAIITYLRRYALSAMLGVYADEDVEGEHNKPKAEKPKTEQAPPPAPPAPKTNGDEKASGGAWTEWHILADQARKLGLDPPIPTADCTTAALRAAYGKLRDEVKEKERENTILGRAG